MRPDTPGLTYAPDGSLMLYIQTERPVGVPEGNWLPAARSVFILGLCTYLSMTPILDGTWFPPAPERVG